jgi:hypothetical protein
MRLKILLISLLIVSFGYSQNKDFKKNDISINLFRLTESPSNTKDIFNNTFCFIPFCNIKYKRYLNNRNAIRLIYYRPISRETNNQYGDLIDEQKYNEQIFVKIGYEYIFNQNKISPYIAIDLFYQKSEFYRVTGNVTDRDRISETSDKNMFGLTPTIGLNYEIYKNISVGLETNASIINTKELKESFSFCKDGFCSDLIYSKNDNYIEYTMSPILFYAKIRF